MEKKDDSQSAKAPGPRVQCLIIGYHPIYKNMVLDGINATLPC